MEVPFSQSLPPEAWRRLINEYALILPSTAQRLKFTRNVLKYFHADRKGGRSLPFRSERSFRASLEWEIERLLPGSRILVEHAIQNGNITRPEFVFWPEGRLRRYVVLMLLVGLCLAISYAGIFFYEMVRENERNESAITGPYRAKFPVEKPALEQGKQPSDSAPLLDNQVPLQTLKKHTATQTNSEQTISIEKSANVDPEENTPKGVVSEYSEYIKFPIWLVEKTGDAETYSNGLQIITTFSVENIPRRYVVFKKDDNALPKAETVSSEIRGILYHVSEGDMAPFKQEKNRLLKQYSSQLLEYACRKKGYHYLIDRFGRVYRIVREQDAAFHAGNSVWADKNAIFLNLNHAFLGVCFEGKGFEEVRDDGSKKLKIRALDDTTITEAQIRSGKELTEWLRFHYQISENNCVPHGLASVYPKDRLIGYHLDLAFGFPFSRFGLRNKYNEMIPSITQFGFKADHYFREVLNGYIWPGIDLSEEYLKNRAKREGVSTEAYREKLHKRFERYYDWQKQLQDSWKLEEVSKNEPEKRVGKVNP